MPDGQFPRPNLFDLVDGPVPSRRRPPPIDLAELVASGIVRPRPVAVTTSSTGPAPVRAPVHYDCSLGVGQGNCREGLDLRAGDTVATGQTTITIQDDGEFRIAPALSRGGAAILSDDEIAAVIFNETRSYQGQGLERARADMAHAIVNGDESLGASRPIAASTTAQIPPTELATYDECVAAVRKARGERFLGFDPTNGATHFNQRPNGRLRRFQGSEFQTQSGPFTNSFPSADLPATGIYSLTYE